MRQRNDEDAKARLLWFIVQQLRVNNTRLLLGRTYEVCSGKNDASAATFAPDDLGGSIDVVFQYSCWFDSLVHEYAHLVQVQSGLWASRKDSNKWETFGDWIDGLIESNPRRILDCTRTIQSCELDAEKRARRLKKRFGVRLDERDETLNTNVYVLSYEAMRRTRRLPSRKYVTESSGILEVTPSDRYVTRLDLLPQGFLEAYIKDCAER